MGRLAIKSVVFPLLLAGFFVISCQKQSEKAKPEVDTSKDVEAIRSWCDQLMASVKAGDVEGTIALQAENVVYMPQNEPAVIGTNNARLWEQAAMKNFNQQEILKLNEIEVVGDWAFVRGDYTYLAIPKQGGQPIQDKGKFIDIFRRMSTGVWKCTHTIWNSDVRSSSK